MKSKYIPYLLLALAILVIIIQCDQDPPETIIETVIETKVDTIKTVQIQEKPIIKYVTKVKTLQGKDSIIYVSKPIKPDQEPDIIQANEFSAKINSNKAAADLQILCTGELLDVSGVITYPEVKTTVKTIKNASGLFLYGETSVQPFFERAAVGVDWQIKNKMIIGTSVSYNNTSKSTNLNLKLGFRIL